MSMNPEELVKNGDLKGALSALQDRVRSNPSSNSDRVFLFQLLAVLGQWERAMTQLDVASELDPMASLMAQTCRPLVRCELFRQEVFNATRTPLIFGEPNEWMGTLLQALQPAAGGDGRAANRVAGEAFNHAATTTGTIDGRTFKWLADADMRLGPTLEVIVNAKYYWVPINHIAKISIYPPEDLRDLVWIPAEFTWRNEGESVGFIPSRYPDSTSDPMLSLGRKTEWKDLGDGYFVGKGQKVFSTDTGEFPLLEVRDILFNHSDNVEQLTAEQIESIT